MKDLLEWYRNQNKLHRKYAYKILLDIKSWFMAQPSLVDIIIPEEKKFTICGDIHGQYYDLLNIFKLNGLPSETNPYVSFIRVDKCNLHKNVKNPYIFIIYKCAKVFWILILYTKIYYPKMYFS